ncbi:type II toxin-antitoxin system RelE/ParE family toxin [Patescibacteria group bacterium]|nr:type II toxin-antitoxin system RelE/ParE family toxin [Patescibacteria group bacterium]
MKIKIINRKIEVFIEGLEKIEVAKVLRTIDLLEKFGLKLGMPHCKKINNELFELRVKGKREIRILYSIKNGQIVLLHGFIKKTRKIPSKEILLAERRLKSLEFV